MNTSITSKTIDRDRDKITRSRIWVSWSSGKDSYAALRTLLSDDSYLVDCLFTVIDTASGQIPMHAVSVNLVKQQVNSLGLKHRLVTLDGDDKDSGIRRLLDDARQCDTDCFAFGDLFLENIRYYREQNMIGTGIETIFPMWQSKTDNLIDELINSGMRAIITSVDLDKLPVSFLGKELTLGLVDEIVALGCDPCGEHGEFHSFVFAGPLFRQPVCFERQDPLIGEGYAHLPLKSVN